MLVPITGTDSSLRSYSYVAFVPDPLPATMNLEDATWRRIVSATAALARLDQAAQMIPDPALLRRPTLRREAQSTSALEGTHAAFTDVLEADLDRDLEHRSPEVREVFNYVVAAEHAFDWVQERPISLGMLQDLHGMLVRGTRGETHDPGRLRQRQVVIGSYAGAPIEEARFVPPPPGDQLQSGLEHLLDWINDSASRELPLVRAALAHYQFETLHPFADGNGRIGRLLIVLQLMREAALKHPVLIVSPWFEARRREYQDHLLRVSQTGDYDEWIRFFCTGLEAQIASTADRLQQLIGLQSRIDALLDAQRVRGVASDVARGIIGRPVVTPSWAADEFNVSYTAANNAVGKLVELGILEEMTGRSYGRIFANRDALRLLEQ
jgi:Fic family protein